MKITLQNKTKVGAVSVNFADVPAVVYDSQIITLPLKDPKKTTRRQWDRLLRKVVRLAKSYQVEILSLDISNVPMYQQLGWDRPQMLVRLVSNLYLANYDFRRYKTKPKDGWKDVKEVIVVGEFNTTEKKQVNEALIVAGYTDHVRDLANARGVDMTPKVLVSEVKKITKGLPIFVQVFGEAQIKKMGMGALEAVGRGSDEETQFIVMEYWGIGKAEGRPKVLVGKGITFDTGGLYVKPSGTMNDMNMDMSGAANVIGAICAVAKLGLKKNVVAIIPAAENAISGKAYRPGDILTTLSKKTVEVLHTDAEGRLVLADALTYAKRYEPEQVVDVATLTGACLVALGQRASAILSNDDNLANDLIKAGQLSGDEAWQLPLWPEYEADITSNHADIANLHNKALPYGGTILGATFLHKFIDDYKWAHIDMASRMTSIPEDNLEVGATGEPMRLLVEWLK